MVLRNQFVKDSRESGEEYGMLTQDRLDAWKSFDGNTLKFDSTIDFDIGENGGLPILPQSI